MNKWIQYFEESSVMLTLFCIAFVIAHFVYDAEAIYFTAGIIFGLYLKKKDTKDGE